MTIREVQTKKGASQLRQAAFKTEQALVKQLVSERERLVVDDKPLITRSS